MKKKELEKGADASLSVVNIRPAQITAFFWICISALLVANITVLILKFGFHHHSLRGMTKAFFFDNEANYPTMYSGLAIIFAASLLWKISLIKSETIANRRSWRFLSLLFLFLAADELFSLHEFLITPTKHMLGSLSFDSGFLYFAWFVPYVLLMLFCGVFLIRFFFRLPQKTRVRFVLAGIVFVAGAVGMEMIGGNYWQAQGWDVHGEDDIDLTYAAIVTIEELLEMVGIALFVHALSDYYLSRKSYSFQVNLVSQPSDASSHSPLA